MSACNPKTSRLASASLGAAGAISSASSLLSCSWRLTLNARKGLWSPAGSDTSMKPRMSPCCNLLTASRRRTSPFRSMPLNDRQTTENITIRRTSPSSSTSSRCAETLKCSREIMPLKRSSKGTAGQKSTGWHVRPTTTSWPHRGNSRLNTSPCRDARSAPSARMHANQPLCFGSSTSRTFASAWVGSASGFRQAGATKSTIRFKDSGLTSEDGSRIHRKISTNCVNLGLISGLGSMQTKASSATVRANCSGQLAVASTISTALSTLRPRCSKGKCSFPGQFGCTRAGGRPVKSSSKTMPKLCASLPSVTIPVRRYSGHAYPGVPLAALTRCCADGDTRARPKSAILAVPFLSRRMLALLMSLWNARGRALCRCERPLAASRATAKRCAARNGRLPLRLCRRRPLRSPPERYSYTRLRALVSLCRAKPIRITRFGCRKRDRTRTSSSKPEKSWSLSTLTATSVPSAMVPL
mmetsp:Transcript_60428/g.179953  ORF Transcript_60428/g.179953 Transcript_60428/m.179953 type:complete len:470 (-) Transcript_60428:258-1667(-)